MATIQNWQLEALGVAWWEELERDVSFDGSTYTVTDVFLNPDALEGLRVTPLTGTTVQLDYDQDKRP